MTFLKIIISSFVMLSGLLNGQAAAMERPEETTHKEKMNLTGGLKEKLLDPEQGLFDLHRVYTIRLENGKVLEPLKENIESVLEYINIDKLKENCEKELHARCNKLGLPSYKVGLYCVINLSPISIILQGHEMSSHTCSIFASCYDDHVGKLPFHAPNTLFLSLNMQDFEGSENLFAIREWMPCLSSPCEAFIFGRADSDEAALAKRQLLEQYNSYIENDEKTLDVLKRAFPKLSDYIDNPEGFEQEIKDKQVVFTYEKVMQYP